MSGFRFPPPPPPPPPSAQKDEQVGQYISSGPRGRGRGRGNGRGSIEKNGRGRSGMAPGGSQHGSSQHMSYGRPNHPSDLRGQAQVFEPYSQPDYLNSARTTTSANSTIFPAGLFPPGSHVNPAFVRPGTGHASWTGPGMPYNARGGGLQVGNRQSNPHIGGIPERSYAHHRTELQPHAGHKRKFHSVQHEDTPTNPSTPSFGGSIVPQKSHHLPEASQFKTGTTQIPGKSHVNRLGLTPRDLDSRYSSSESDEEEDLADEESALASGLGPQLMFHDVNGEMRKLETAADLLAWRKARRNNFPSKENISAREAERRRLGAVRWKLLTEARDALQNAVSEPYGSNAKSTAVRTGAETAKSGNARLDQRETNAPCHGSQKKQPQVNGLAPTSSTSMLSEDEQKTAIDPETSSVAPKPLAASANGSEPDSDDDGPEETTTTQRPKNETAQTACRYFAASGYCRDGTACRFKHELPSGVRNRGRANMIEKFGRDPYAPVLDAPDQGGKKTIHQRLLEREQEGEDQLALQVIKYLGDAGFFAAE